MKNEFSRYRKRKWRTKLVVKQVTVFRWYSVIERRTSTGEIEKIPVKEDSIQLVDLLFNTIDPKEMPRGRTYTDLVERYGEAFDIATDKLDQLEKDYLTTFAGMTEHDLNEKKLVMSVQTDMFLEQDCYDFIINTILAKAPANWARQKKIMNAIHYFRDPDKVKDYDPNKDKEKEKNTGVQVPDTPISTPAPTPK